MKRLFSLGLCASAALMSVSAQAVPVALHYNFYGPGAQSNTGITGNLNLSFDLYYDPTLFGSVASNGGLITNGHYSFVSSSFSTQPYAIGGTLTDLQATVSMPSPTKQYPGGYEGLSITAGGPVTAFAGSYITPTGTFAFNDFTFGGLLTAGTTRYVAELTYVTTSAVPETATWIMMMAGVGLVGGALRRRKVSTRVAFA